MRNLLLIFTLSALSTNALKAQQATHIFLSVISKTEDGFNFSTPKQISEGSGYHNQPSFSDKSTLLFASTRQKQTDIASYNITENTLKWKSNTLGGSEYSPQRIPNSNAIAAVRLDTNGLQRFYKYRDGKTPELLLENLQVAYYCFTAPDKILASVLENNTLALVEANLHLQQIDTIFFGGSGRSFHSKPDSNTIAYTMINEAEANRVEIYLNEEDDSFFVCQLPIGIQDFTWLTEDIFVIGSRNQLYTYNTIGNYIWTLAHTFKDTPIDAISRIAVSPDGKYLAFAATLKTTDGQ